MRIKFKKPKQLCDTLMEQTGSWKYNHKFSNQGD